MKIPTRVNSIILISLIFLSKSGSKPTEKTIEIEDFPINDSQAFYSEYENPDSKHPEIIFIKQFFPTKDTTLNHDAYTHFLQDYLQTHAWKLTSDERKILKSIKEDYLTVVDSYMNEHKSDKGGEYRIENAYLDLVHGDFWHFVHDVIDHGGPVDEGENIGHDDEFGDDL